MSSRVSDSDVQIFSNLVNPMKTRLEDLKSDFVDGLIDTAQQTRKSEQENSFDDYDAKPTNDEEVFDQHADPDPDRSYEDAYDERSFRNPDTEKEDEDTRYSRIEEVEDEDYHGFSEERKDTPPRANTPLSAVSSTRVDANELIDKESVMSPPRSRRESDKASSVGSYRSHSPDTKHESSGPFSSYMRTDNHRAPKSRANTESMTDLYVKEKQNVLMDIERLKMQGIHFSKQYTIHDSIEDMQYEIRRHMLHIEEMNNMNMMRDGMRMMCTGIEMLNGKLKLMELNGWSQDVCADMNKYDTALSKIYRKYWRKSHSVAPELEIAMSILTSAGMYHFKKKISKHVLSSKLPTNFNFGKAPAKRPTSPSLSSEDGSESPPP